jgi:iron complex outermembrane recepter protein
MKYTITYFLCLFGIYGIAFGQDFTVSGRVVDSNSGQGVAGVNIQVKGTALGTITDGSGNFSIQISGERATLVFTFIGYKPKEVDVNSLSGVLNVPLEEDITSLRDVVVVGSRFNPRSIADSPVPIDNVDASSLISTGQLTFDKMLTYKLPSYNSTQQTISDATAHFDPFDLRGLGPSRTLVLINGKRKNPSSLVYINDTPGKGEVGVDMKSIPIAAIERVEVLRDGASAQYGSDAIAGVINVVLKERINYSNVNLFGGITTEGDGRVLGFRANTGFEIGNGGFINVSASFSDEQRTDRSGTPGKDDLFGEDESHPFIVANPDLGMTVGSPDMTTNDFFFNARVPLKDGQTEVYSFGGLTYRKGLSFALYRTPYWIPDTYNLLHPVGSIDDGFQPTFETDIFDNSLAFGIRGKKGEWQFDLSTTRGSNSVDYTVDNSINVALGPNSPTRFKTGGYYFSNTVNNVDLSRKFGNLIFSVGSEFRIENFKAFAGDSSSYSGGGVQSFPGLQPDNEVNEVRYNIGIYSDLSYDISRNFLIGGAVRYESYSDFGSNFTWKFSTRLKFADDKWFLRSSVSTGFRAPSLHQIYLSNIQTLVSGGTVSNQGTFNNRSTVVKQLAVPELKEENSFNFTAGIAFRPTDRLSFTADFYRINVDDRIVFTSSLANDDVNTPVGKILDDYNITSIKFFINAVNTITQGIDLVANYSDISLGNGRMDITLSANFNENNIKGKINTPQPIAASNNDIFDRKEQSRILTARPNDKIVFGLRYDIGKLGITLNNTRFGEVTWRHADNGLNASLGMTDPEFDQTFSAKIITDLNLNYRITDFIDFSVSINNLFNVYPDVIDTKGDFVTDLGGRFKYPWEVNQFGFNGTTILGSINFKL